MTQEPDRQAWQEFGAAVAALGPRMNRFLADFRPAVTALFEHMHAHTAPVREWLNEHGPVIGSTVAALAKLSAESHVENWKDLDEEQWMRALELMRVGDGVPLAWTPPVHVVEALLAAPDHDGRDAVLLARADEIETDARRLLALVTHSDLQMLRAATEQGWDAWSAKLSVPAQTTAATVVTDVLLQHGFEDFGPFRIAWEPFRDVPVEQWKLTELRTTALMCALSTAVQAEWQKPGPGFNRMSTAHRVDPEQFNDANTLRGLMLATAAVRELQFERSHEWLHASGFKRPRMNSDPSDPSVLLGNSAVLQTLVDGMRSPATVTEAERASTRLSARAKDPAVRPAGPVVVAARTGSPAQPPTPADEDPHATATSVPGPDDENGPAEGGPHGVAG